MAIKEIEKYLLLAAVLGTFAFASPVMGATATNSIAISATVSAACQISSVGNISFGAYDPLSAMPKDAAGNIVLRCVKGTSYKTYIVGTRSMSGGSDTLGFDLYTDVGRTTTFPVDNSTGGVTALNSSPITKDVYGRIPPGQDVGAASYTATLVATVEY